MIKFACLVAKCLRLSTLFLLCATFSITIACVCVSGWGESTYFLRVKGTMRCLVNRALAF